jgi:hypothetical protein
MSKEHLGVVVRAHRPTTWEADTGGPAPRSSRPDWATVRPCVNKPDQLCLPMKTQALNKVPGVDYAYLLCVPV